MMKMYRGKIDKDGEQHVCITYVAGKPNEKLDPRYDLANHSPDGFSWGYGGSGPAQLALAMLCDALEMDAVPLQIYQDFKWLFLARIPQDQEWAISSVCVEAIAKWICASERHKRTQGVKTDAEA